MKLGNAQNAPRTCRSWPGELHSTLHTALPRALPSPLLVRYLVRYLFLIDKNRFERMEDKNQGAILVFFTECAQTCFSLRKIVNAIGNALYNALCEPKTTSEGARVAPPQCFHIHICVRLLPIFKPPWRHSWRRPPVKLGLAGSGWLTGNARVGGTSRSHQIGPCLNQKQLF